MKIISRILFFSLILLIGTFSCEKATDKIDIKLDELQENTYYESEIFNESNLDIYGKWKLYSVSGGIHGDGHELNFNYLEIYEFGIYGFIENGGILEFGRIIINDQNNNELLITFMPDDNSEVFMHDSEKYVNLFGKDTLSLDSPCCDRYNYRFERIN